MPTKTIDIKKVLTPGKSYTRDDCIDIINTVMPSPVTGARSHAGDHAPKRKKTGSRFDVLSQQDARDISGRLKLTRKRIHSTCHNEDLAEALYKYLANEARSDFALITYNRTYRRSRAVISIEVKSKSSVPRYVTEFRRGDEHRSYAFTNATLVLDIDDTGRFMTLQTMFPCPAPTNGINHTVELVNVIPGRSYPAITYTRGAASYRIHSIDGKPVIISGGKSGKSMSHPKYKKLVASARRSFGIASRDTRMAAAHPTASATGRRAPMARHHGAGAGAGYGDGAGARGRAPMARHHGAGAGAGYGDGAGARGRARASAATVDNVLIPTMRHQSTRNINFNIFADTAIATHEKTKLKVIAPGAGDPGDIERKSVFFGFSGDVVVIDSKALKKKRREQRKARREESRLKKDTTSSPRYW